MPAPRRSLRKLNIAQLAEVSGLSDGTVSDRLNKSGVEPAEIAGKIKRFDAPQALRLLLGGDKLDPKREAARLDSARADMAELDVAAKRGEYVPLSEHEELLFMLCSGLVMKMRGLPSRAAPEVRVAPSDAEGEALLRKLVDEALADVADAGARAEALLRAASERDAGLRDGAAVVATTPDGDGQPVG